MRIKSNRTKSQTGPSFWTYIDNAFDPRSETVNVSVDSEEAGPATSGSERNDSGQGGLGAFLHNQGTSGIALVIQKFLP